MNSSLRESVTKAAQCADLLVGDLRDAQKRACDDEPALELLLRDLLAEAAKVRDRLTEIDGAIR
jgi:hypothetical protein